MIINYFFLTFVTIIVYYFSPADINSGPITIISGYRPAHWYAYEINRNCRCLV